nr:hypothetical protein [Tanacetum cinerariifolium]
AETTIVSSPTGLCGLVPYSNSDSDLPDEMASPEYITPLPATSPILLRILIHLRLLILLRHHHRRTLMLLPLLVGGAGLLELASIHIEHSLDGKIFLVVVWCVLDWMDFHELGITGDLLSINVYIDDVDACLNYQHCEKKTQQLLVSIQQLEFAHHMVGASRVNNEQDELHNLQENYREVVPFGRPYRTRPDGLRRLLTARNRVGPVPACRLARRCVSPRSSDHHSSSSSLSLGSAPVHSG